MNDTLREERGSIDPATVVGGIVAALSRETAMGHVHLHVAHLVRRRSVYAGVLGFQVMQRYVSGAFFKSAGGYHHHIGLNSWTGVGAAAAPPGAIGLRHFVVRRPDDSIASAATAR